jgi:hypothetical protein
MYTNEFVANFHKEKLNLAHILIHLLGHVIYNLWLHCQMVGIRNIIFNIIPFSRFGNTHRMLNTHYNKTLDSDSCPEKWL